MKAPALPDELARPRPTPLTEPFWAGCAAHRLLIQRCGVCGAHVHAPKPTCPRCGSTDRTWTESCGAGSVFTYTMVHRPVIEALKDSVPYAIVVVQLDDCDGALVTSNLVGASVDDVAVGLRVRVTWADVAPDAAVFLFEPEAP